MQVARDKRRKRDAHLKEQAKLAKKKKKPEIASTPPDNDENAKQSKKFDIDSLLENGKLPDYLPDEILAQDSIPRPPVLPTKTQSKASISSKRKFVDADPKPPKDIRRGNKLLRVLQSNQTTLPPRPSKKSKSIRESWLKGERGRANNTVASKRRKVGGGFLG